MISKRKDFCKNYSSNPNIEIFKELFKTWYIKKCSQDNKKAIKR